MGKKFVLMLSEQSGRMTALGLMVTLSVTMVLSGVLLSYDANAGALTSVSDTLTESAPSSTSDHTIVFTAQTTVAIGGSIRITFPAGFTGVSGITTGDVTAATSPGGTLMGTASASGQVLEITTATNAIDPADVVTIVVGGTNKISNPSTVASYQINAETRSAGDAILDSGLTFVAIVNGVTLHAYVAPSFTFVIDGMLTSELIDTQVVGSQSEDSYVGFGTLTAGTPIMMGSSLSVSTNAQNGFKVTVHQNHNMMTSSSADIDAFVDGTVGGSAVAWAAPTGTLGSENTYGHLGIHSEDGSNTVGGWDNVSASVSSTTNGYWLGVSSTPTEVWDWNSSADGVTQDVGHIDVGYRVEITALQEYGHYYNRLTYIATPTF